jgi:hypothetical protein
MNSKDKELLEEAQRLANPTKRARKLAEREKAAEETADKEAAEEATREKAAKETADKEAARKKAAKEKAKRRAARKEAAKEAAEEAALEEASGALEDEIKATATRPNESRVVLVEGEKRNYMKRKSMNDATKAISEEDSNNAKAANQKAAAEKAAAEKATKRKAAEEAADEAAEQKARKMAKADKVAERFTDMVVKVSSEPVGQWTVVQDAEQTSGDEGSAAEAGYTTLDHQEVSYEGAVSLLEQTETQKLLEANCERLFSVTIDLWIDAFSMYLATVMENNMLPSMSTWKEITSPDGVICPMLREHPEAVLNRFELVTTVIHLARSYDNKDANLANLLSNILNQDTNKKLLELIWFGLVVLEAKTWKIDRKEGDSLNIQNSVFNAAVILQSASLDRINIPFEEIKRRSEESCAWLMDEPLETLLNINNNAPALSGKREGIAHESEERDTSSSSSSSTEELDGCNNSQAGANARVSDAQPQEDTLASPIEKVDIEPATTRKRKGGRKSQTKSKEVSMHELCYELCKQIFVEFRAGVESFPTQEAFTSHLKKMIGCPGGNEELENFVAFAANVWKLWLTFTRGGLESIESTTENLLKSFTNAHWNQEFCVVAICNLYKMVIPAGKHERVISYEGVAEHLAGFLCDRKEKKGYETFRKVTQEIVPSFAKFISFSSVRDIFQLWSYKKVADEQEVVQAPYANSSVKTFGLPVPDWDKRKQEKECRRQANPTKPIFFNTRTDRETTCLCVAYFTEGKVPRLVIGVVTRITFDKVYHTTIYRFQKLNDDRTTTCPFEESKQDKTCRIIGESDLTFEREKLRDELLTEDYNSVITWLVPMMFATLKKSKVEQWRNEQAREFMKLRRNRRELKREQDDGKNPTVVDAIEEIIRQKQRKIDSVRLHLEQYVNAIRRAFLVTCMEVRENATEKQKGIFAYYLRSSGLLEFLHLRADSTNLLVGLDQFKEQLCSQCYDDLNTPMPLLHLETPEQVTTFLESLKENEQPEADDGEESGRPLGFDFLDEELERMAEEMNKVNACVRAGLDKEVVVDLGDADKPSIHSWSDLHVLCQELLAPCSVDAKTAIKALEDNAKGKTIDAFRINGSKNVEQKEKPKPTIDVNGEYGLRIPEYNLGTNKLVMTESHGGDTISVRGKYPQALLENLLRSIPEVEVGLQRYLLQNMLSQMQQKLVFIQARAPTTNENAKTFAEAAVKAVQLAIKPLEAGSVFVDAIPQGDVSLSEEESAVMKTQFVLITQKKKPIEHIKPTELFYAMYYLYCKLKVDESTQRCELAKNSTGDAENAAATQLDAAKELEEDEKMLDKARTMVANNMPMSTSPLYKQLTSSIWNEKTNLRGDILFRYLGFVYKLTEEDREAFDHVFKDHVVPTLAMVAYKAPTNGTTARVHKPKGQKQKRRKTLSKADLEAENRRLLAQLSAKETVPSNKECAAVEANESEEDKAAALEAARKEFEAKAKEDKEAALEAARNEFEAKAKEDKAAAEAKAKEDLRKEKRKRLEAETQCRKAKQNTKRVAGEIRFIEEQCKVKDQFGKKPMIQPGQSAEALVLEQSFEKSNSNKDTLSQIMHQYARQESLEMLQEAGQRPFDDANKAKRPVVEDMLCGMSLDTFAGYIHDSNITMPVWRQMCKDIFAKQKEEFDASHKNDDVQEVDGSAFRPRKKALQTLQEPARCNPTEVVDLLSSDDEQAEAQPLKKKAKK